jgi:hypothetical protein
MADCCGRFFFKITMAEFVKDGGAMVFCGRHGSLNLHIFGFLPWSAIHNQ